MKRKKSRGRRTVLIILILEAILIVFILFYIRTKPGVMKAVTVEAGTQSVSVEDFMKESKKKGSFITDMSTIDLNTPGTYEVQIKVGKKTLTSVLKVVDTAAPTASTVNQTVEKGGNIKAESFVKDINDITSVTVTYKKDPDFTAVGDQTVELILTDTSGNTSELKAKLTITDDEIPPEITGVTDKTVYLGDTVSYKKGVTVTDNKDKKVELKIDNSKVNLNKAGSYTVTYSATDSAGNTTTVNATVTVKESIVSMDELNEMAQGILDDITTSDMSKEEIAYAIFQYTKAHIAYTGHSDKSDWVAEAYRGITNAVGDCFTYFAVSQALLNQAGIENMEVNRVGGTTKHYWSMVNLGDGWYHFDSCPNKDHRKTFMLTDAEAEELTEIRGNNYYTFDNSKYPKTPEENPYQ